jgi:transposase
VELDWRKLLPLRGFQVLPRRRVVERSFAWIGHNRRMSKDYERLCSTSEAFVSAAIIRLMPPLQHGGYPQSTNYR